MNKVSESQYVLLKNSQGQSYYNASAIRRFLFGWVFPLIKIGRKQPLGQLDLQVIGDEDSTATSYRYYRVVFEQCKSKGIGLRWALYKSFQKLFQEQIWITLIIYFIVTTLSLLGPYIASKGQGYFIYKENQKPTFQSMIIFAIIQLSYWLCHSLMNPYMMFEQTILSVKLQGALQKHIMQKTIQFNLYRQQVFSSGDLINMLQVHTTLASNFYATAYQLYLLPFYFLFACGVLFVTVGKDSIIPGIGSIFSAIMGFLFGCLYAKLQHKYMKAKDIRMRVFDESMLYVKQIKLNCLEEFFQQRVEKYREEEMKYLKYQVWLLILIQFAQNVIGLITCEIAFALAPTLTFGTMNILIQNYNSIAKLMAKLPNLLRNYYRSLDSIAKIQSFLDQEEILFKQYQDDVNQVNQTMNSVHSYQESEPLCVQQSTHSARESTSIKINDGRFSWDSTKTKKKQQIEHMKFTINLNFEIMNGQFIAFVGNAASGKSSILRSIIGEMKQLGQNYTINGVISLATQEPWIISGSVKQNITYLNHFDIVKYRKVVAACGLKQDIEQLKNGDETVLGEKGDNLSGGQQKRINLARAVYSDADIYLLDDPMSALDIKIRQHIHEKCIMGYLKGKTRVIFTNSMAYLQDADRIFVVNDGQIVDSGSFHDLNPKQATMPIQTEKKNDSIDTQFEQSANSTRQVEKFTQPDQQLICLEDQKVGTISSKVLKQIYKYQGGLWAIIVSILSTIALVLCQLYGYSILTSQKDDKNFRMLAIIYYPLIQLSNYFSQILLKTYFLLIGFRASKLIHEKIISSLLVASFTKFYNVILIGRLMNRLSKDLYVIDVSFPSEISGLIYQFSTLILPLIQCAVYLNIVSLPLPILLVIVLTYITIGYYRCLREVTRIEAVSKSPVFAFYQQILRGVTYVRTCLPIDKVLKLQEQNVDLDLANQVTLFGVKYWYSAYVGVLTNVILTMLFIVCFLFPGTTQKSTYLVLSQLQIIANYLVASAIAYGNVQMYSISFERGLHLAFGIEKENYNAPVDTIDMGLSQTDNGAHIEFHNCSFQYRPNSKEVLSNFTASIRKGEKIGVVGRTGAGKSSIILALTGIIDQLSGKLRIDGKYIEQYGLKELRQKYSVIPQDPLIFMGTLRDNLDPLKEYETDKIEEACQNCQLFSLDSFKADQLLTQISVGGCNLSMGEKQMITIARCVLQNRKIILVDEATASIDGPTEMKIKQMFEQYFQSNTVITIAHKVTTIMDSNRIMVLDDGKIVEFDTPRKLLEDDNSEFCRIMALIQQSESI